MSGIDGFMLLVGLVGGAIGMWGVMMMLSGLPLPYSRYSMARFLVLYAMRLIPQEDWAWERLWWVNDSLKRSIAQIKTRRETGGEP